MDCSASRCLETGRHGRRAGVLHVGGLAVVLLVGSALVEAQPLRALDTPIRFRHLAVEGGPAEHNVFAISQDDLGFVWFGTDNGLARFDGIEARTYRPVPFDTTSLSDPWVWDFVADGEGGFWVTTVSGGLNRYDPARDAFRRHPDLAPARMKQVVRDAEGTLWIGTSYDGLLRFDPATGQSERFTADPADPTALPDDRIEALLLDRTGALWVGTWEGGLSRFDPATGRFQTYRPVAGDSTSLPVAHVQALLEDRRGRLWVGTAGGGVVRYDPGTDAFVRTSVAGAAEPRRDDVHALLEDPDGMLWVGSKAGLDRFDPETGRFIPYRHDPADPTSLGAGIVYALAFDRSGVLWVGREFGASYFEWAPSPFEHYTHDPDDANSLNDDDVFVVFEDRAGTLWAGTTVGLNRIDRETGRITRYAPDPSDPTRLASGTVMGINETRDGTFWVTSRPGGLHRFDRATGKVVERFAYVPGDTTTVFSENPWWILEDDRGRTWVTNGGEGCLNRMRRATGTFTPVCHDPDDPNTPADDFARYLIEARDGTLWLGTWGGGLDRIDPETGRYTHYRHDPADRNTPSSDFILFLGEADDGTLWLGTFGAGFSHFDPATETFTHYTVGTSDLPDNTVYGIQPGSAGRLWLSTNAGLVRFDPETEAFQVFEVADGLQSLEFNSGASFRSPSGELFFGGPNGFNAFRPDRIRARSVPPPVVLTGIAVEGEPAGPDSAALAVAAPLADEVRLAPGQRDVAFTFAALHFVNPARNRYRVRLDGYDTDWHTPKGEPEATYTNLDPGRYTFRVQAANSDGVWNDDGVRLAVIVEPFFFETWWFAVLCGLAAVGLLQAGYRARVRQLRRRQEGLEVLVRERTRDLRVAKQTSEERAERLREVDRLKSRFFTNVSHEFRTPLTLTIGPLEDLQTVETSLPAPAQRKVDLALRSSRRLLHLINQLLDVAKLEVGEMRLAAQQQDLAAFLSTLSLTFAPLAERRSVRFDVELPAEPLLVWFDSEKLGQVVGNLLSNAFKFTPEGGAIRVTLEADSDESAVLSVRDSGPGIPADVLPHLFERFYQVEKTHAALQAGTGIGLSLAKELTELHGGRIAVESTIGFGSMFMITLPLGRAHLREDQLAGAETLHAAPQMDGAALAFGSDYSDHSVSDVADDADDRTTVLVADDNADIRAYIRGHLAARYRVLEAADGAEALAIVRDALPDLVVSDVMMPEMDGFEFVRALRADRDTDFIPVILLTAKATADERVEGLGEGADDYLTKPFNIVELEARVENLITSRQRLKSRFLQRSPEPPSAGLYGAPASGDGADAEPDPLSASDRAFVDRVRAAVEAQIADEDFSVEQLAESVSVSRSTLHLRLRTAIDETPSGFIKAIRLEQAAGLLREREGTVSEVAYAVGFKSVSHFSQSFRKAYDMSPSTFADVQAPT